MTNDTINNIINDAYDLATGAATTPSIGIKSIARRLEQLVKDGFHVAPEAARKFAEEKMTRPEAVRILMQLQKVDASAGNVNITRAYEMAIAHIVKRHRNDCRNKAKRRAAAMSAAAKEEK